MLVSVELIIYFPKEDCEIEEFKTITYVVSQLLGLAESVCEKNIDTLVEKSLLNRKINIQAFCWIVDIIVVVLTFYSI